MKQFILKNIVLAVILLLTLIGSIFLAFFIWEKSQTIKDSMQTIQEDGEKLKSINAARKPNSVEQSEKMIKADTETLNKKNTQIYRRFGKPYRPALLKLIKNIASPAELKTDLPLDPDLVAKPKPKPEEEEDAEAEKEEVAKTAPAEPSAPTDEEKAVFNPASNLVVLSYDEDTLHAALAEVYGEDHQESSDDDDTTVIPDTIMSERAQIFEKLFNRIIEPPEVVDPARAEDFRKAAAAKFARAFAIFRQDVQAETLEDVSDSVAHEIFLEALGLPRLMRQIDCKNYIDFLYEKYLASAIIPGTADVDLDDRRKIVQECIYGKNANLQAPPVADKVIPIIRNMQIKEDLFRRMKDSGIAKLRSMNSGVSYGTPLDGDSESPILAFTYTLEMTASMEAIDTFINSLHSAYKTDRVYVIKDIKLVSPYEDLVLANGSVAGHRDDDSKPSRAATAATANPALPAEAQQPVAIDPITQLPIVYTRSEYELTDPHHPDYGQTLFEDIQNEINCTIVVDYLYYRADNITPQ